MMFNIMFQYLIKFIVVNDPNDGLYDRYIQKYYWRKVKLLATWEIPKIVYAFQMFDESIRYSLFKQF